MNITELNITKLGEFGLIAKIKDLFSKDLPAGIVGIDDDCAVIPQGDGRALLVTTDSLVENTHFIRYAIDARDLGYKTAAVNLSDIAAMGGTPKYIWLTVALPDDLKSDWLDKYLSGLHEILSQHKVYLLGGDTVYSEQDIFISATVLGEGETKKIKYRSSAEVGDVICVAGNLGDSLAGLHCLLQSFPRKELISKLIDKHYRPNPQIAEGLFFAQQKGVNAMMDLSDGLNSDLARIMAASQCGADIYLDTLPVSSDLVSIAPRLGFDVLEMAAVGGEDYVLLISVNPEAYSQVAQEFQQQFSRPLTKIGEITAKKNSLQYFLQEKPYQLKMKSFSHFRES
jgi:thiamine-monophosphate kinase